MAKYLTRTWVGDKPFHYLDPQSGKRVKVEKGESIKVTSSQAQAFAHAMVDPRVAEAQKAAKQAEAAAKAESKEEDNEAPKQQAEKPATPKPQAQTSQG